MCAEHVREVISGIWGRYTKSSKKSKVMWDKITQLQRRRITGGDEVRNPFPAEKQLTGKQIQQKSPGAFLKYQSHHDKK